MGGRENLGKRFSGWDSRPSRPEGDSGLLSMKTLEKNMQTIDSKIVKDAKKAMRKQLILEEKVKVQLKLDSIENQRKKILAEHKAYKMAKNS
jgi:hypothetical protein